MIIDTIQNAHKYYSVHPLFQTAFEYIAAQNLAAIETGKFDISDGLKVINNTAVGKQRKRVLQNLNVIIKILIFNFVSKGRNKWDGSQGVSVYCLMGITTLKKMCNCIWINRILFLV